MDVRCLEGGGAGIGCVWGVYHQSQGLNAFQGTIGEEIQAGEATVDLVVQLPVDQGSDTVVIGAAHEGACDEDHPVEGLPVRVGLQLVGADTGDVVAEDGAVDDRVRGVVKVEVVLDQGILVPVEAQSLLGRAEGGRGEGRGGDELEVGTRGARDAFVCFEQAVDVSQQRSCR